MNKPYLIALDLDGTLLKDDKTISQKTKDVLKRVQDKGHKVMISTGRPFRSSEMYYKELGLTTPIVNFNGAFTHHPLDANWGSFHETLSLETVREIIDACAENKIENVIAEVLDHVYVHYHDEKIMDFFLMGNPTVTTGDIKTYLKDNPTSLLIYSDPENVHRIREILNQSYADAVEHRSWGVPWSVVEIIKNGINKAVGVKKVADYYDIPQDRKSVV